MLAQVKLINANVPEGIPKQPSHVQKQFVLPKYKVRSHYILEGQTGFVKVMKIVHIWVLLRPTGAFIVGGMGFRSCVRPCVRSSVFTF